MNIPGHDIWKANLTWPTRPGPHLYGLPAASWADGNEAWDVIGAVLSARDLSPSASGWDPVVAAAVARYRDGVVLAGDRQAHHMFGPGLARHHLETKDPRSLEALDAMNPGDSVATIAGDFSHPGTVRETALKLRNAMAAESAGLGPNPRLDALAAAALGQLEQWSAPADRRRYGSYVKPWMGGVGMLALIVFREAHLATRDPARAALVARVPAAVAAGCDYLWRECTFPAGSNVDGGPWPGVALTYQDRGYKHPALAPIEGLEIEGAYTERIFRGPDTLDPRDDHYKFAGIEFTDGPLGEAYDRFLVTDYDGPNRAFGLSPTYFPNKPIRPGDHFRIVSLAHPDDDPGPVPDLNHLAAPAFAWSYWHERRVNGDTPRARELRARFVAFFSGGWTAIRPPVAQKHWNQSLYGIPFGLECLDRADALKGDAGTDAGPPTSRAFSFTARRLPQRFEFYVPAAGPFTVKQLPS